MRKPYYKKSNKLWYVNIDGRQVRLGRTEEEAYAAWERIRAAGGALCAPDVQFRALADRWLTEHRHELTNVKFELYCSYLGRFCKHIGSLQARELSKSTVYAYLAKPHKNHKGQKVAKVWSPSTKRDIGSLFKRVMEWALGEGLIPRNPIHDIKLPAGATKERVVADSEHSLLIAKVRKQKRNAAAFGLVLIALRSGVRQQQIREVTAENVTADFTRWVFTKHKTAEKTTKPLVVYLSPCMQTLTRALVAQRPKGRLFLQDSGKPWSKDTLSQKLRRSVAKLSLDDITAHSYRHTYATNALASGVEIATVSQLLGHADVRMVSRVYGHLDQHGEFLLNAVRRIKANPGDQDSASQPNAT